jgi:hypothetical protein
VWFASVCENLSLKMQMVLQKQGKSECA